MQLFFLDVFRNVKLIKEFLVELVLNLPTNILTLKNLPIPLLHIIHQLLMPPCLKFFSMRTFLKLYQISNRTTCASQELILRVPILLNLCLGHPHRRCVILRSIDR